MKSILLITNIFLITFLSSCSSNSEEIIEIYLTKNRIESFEGVAVKEAIKDSTLLKNVIHDYGPKVRVDTLNHKLIYMGKFKVTQKDLEQNPFIENSEIIGIDIEKSRIHFKSSVADKIYKSIPHWKNPKLTGRQFVLCKNKEIIFSGYLLGSMSSYWSSTFTILYSPKQVNQDEVSYFIFDSLNLDPKYLSHNKKINLAFRNRKIN